RKRFELKIWISTSGKPEYRQSTAKSATESPEFLLDSSVQVACRLQLFTSIWQSFFGNCWAISLIKDGYTPEWSSPPLLKVSPISFRKIPIDTLQVYKEEVSSLLTMGAIVEIDSSVPCFVSNLFLVPKKNG